MKREGRRCDRHQQIGLCSLKLLFQGRVATAIGERRFGASVVSYNGGVCALQRMIIGILCRLLTESLLGVLALYAIEHFLA